ncbi:MAG: hypothetical protein R3B45_02680 [Bdellovibrionota bacterium]
MERVALTNLFIGFCAIFLAACAGSFLALDITEGFIKNKDILSSWQMINLKSAHGHTNLFGLCHIALGLTMPWSKLNQKIKKLQTIGLSMGTVAMSVLLSIQAFLGPSEDLTLLKITLGLFLSAALVSIALQCYGLYVRLRR